MSQQQVSTEIQQIARRIREMRGIIGISVDDMAQKTELSVEQYRKYESGTVDLPFTFIHKCAGAFGIGITDILEGESAHLSGYTVTRKGQGILTSRIHRRIPKEAFYKRLDLTTALKDKFVSDVDSALCCWNRLRCEVQRTIEQQPIAKVGKFHSLGNMFSLNPQYLVGDIPIIGLVLRELNICSIVEFAPF